MMQTKAPQTIRRLVPGEASLAAAIHRRAGELIPGYDTNLHTPAEVVSFYRTKVMVAGPVWGLFEAGALRGRVALLPG